MKHIEVLKDTLSALEAMERPGSVLELPYRWRAEE